MIEYEELGKSNGPFFADLRSSFEATLASGRYILGKNVEQFEREFASYCGVRSCIGVASGMDALALSFAACDLRQGAEVIVPSNTYIATILAVVRAGLTPVLVEPDIRSYTIDPARIEEKITINTAALVAVHLYGRICDMGPIVKTAQQHGLALIEDCAQAHGALYRGRKAGSFGNCAAFSFYPTKNLGALGDGGAVLTDDADRALLLRSLRNYGSLEKDRHDVIGSNSRLDEVQAGFLSVKLKKLDAINTHKKTLARLYREQLKDDFVKPLTDPDHDDVFHIFAVRHPARDRVREYLLKKGIGTAVHYPVPPHRQKALESVLGGGSYPVSEEIHATTLSLPISFGHTEQDVLAVIEAMNGF